MPVTRSRSVERAVTREISARRAAWRSREFLLLIVASLLVAAGLYQVHKAKSQGLPEVEAGLTAKRLLNLNELGAREELFPALAPFFPKTRERDAAARDIYYLTGSLSNVGGIAHRKQWDTPRPRASAAASTISCHWSRSAGLATKPAR